MKRLYAIRLAGAYVAISVLWLLFSDAALLALGLSAERIAAVSFIKGVGFVIVTGSALYLLVSRFERRSHAREREYRELFERNPNPMWVYDLETIGFLAVNEAAVAKYGYARDEFLGMRITDIRPAEDVDRLLENVADVRAGASGQDLDEAGVWRHRTKGGRLLSVEITSHVIEFDGRNAELVMVRDVTEAVEAQQALLRYQADLERQVAERTADIEQANAQLVAATDAKSTFLATMSHELRTPLHSVIGFSSLLANEVPGPLNDEQRLQVGIVHDAGKHLLDLINDVLDLSRVESGYDEVRIDAVSLADIVSSVARTAEPLATAKGLQWRAEITPQTPGVMRTDRRKLVQVLVNLAANAVKYTDSGSVRFLVEPAERGIRFSVVDTGRGIEPDVQERIFREFVRAPVDDVGDQEGTGLGLAISARLAELLGGAIALESTPGQGSTFTLTLPVDGPEVG